MRISQFNFVAGCPHDIHAGWAYEKKRKFYVNRNGLLDPARGEPRGRERERSERTYEEQQTNVHRAFR
ncbi:MAG: hypothetical protein KF708_12095 [Pirellulales bacterium]|nr:hypothetical protein [Pirellulales bacterium]